LRNGDVSDCEIVAFVESTAFGEDRGDDVVVMKSPGVERAVVAIHPIGRRGAEAESKRSTYDEGVTWACAQQRARAHAKRRVFMVVRKADGDMNRWATEDPSPTGKPAELTSCEVLYCEVISAHGNSVCSTFHSYPLPPVSCNRVLRLSREWRAVCQTSSRRRRQG